MAKYYLSSGSYRCLIEKPNIKEAVVFFLNKNPDRIEDYIFVSEKGFDLTEKCDDVPLDFLNDPNYILEANEIAVFNKNDLIKELTNN